MTDEMNQNGLTSQTSENTFIHPNPCISLQDEMLKGVPCKIDKNRDENGCCVKLKRKFRLLQVGGKSLSDSIRLN